MRGERMKLDSRENLGWPTIKKERRNNKVSLGSLDYKFY